MRRSFLSFLLLALFITPFEEVSGQNYVRLDTLEFLESGQVLHNSLAGGLNLPEFSPIDLNQDSLMDLLVFDGEDYAIMPFINEGTPGVSKYSYAPEYIDAFPTDFEEIMLLRDYDCDGKMDIFGTVQGSLRIYRNTSTGPNLSFQLAVSSLKSDYGMGLSPIFFSYADIPAIDDIDGDGDLDILTFDASGSFVEFHKNMSLELFNNCDSLKFELADGCWGKFSEDGLTNDVTLNVTCRRAPGAPEPPVNGVHAGSTLLTYDEDMDGDKELLIGDLLYNNLVYLRNGGSAASAHMDSSQSTFPVYDSPVDIFLFPAAFYLDVNNDNREDLIVAPNSSGVSMNYSNVWLYENVGNPSFNYFSRSGKKFLQSEMLDMGTGAFPTFFDYNGDSLPDLLIGNYTLKTSPNSNDEFSGLTLYENIGTASQPRFELVSWDYSGLSTVFNPKKFGFVPAFGDMDNDGDEDLILGDSDGKIHYFENLGGAGNPANFVLAGAEYMGIDVGQFATPVIVDYDRDGKPDLVIGEMAGNLNYYHNTGTNAVAAFSNTPDDNNWGNVDTQPACCTGYSVPFIYENPTGDYELLVGSEQGNIYRYTDIEANAGGTFPLADTLFLGIREGLRSSITGADINGDGNMEFFAGNIRGGLAGFGVEATVSRETAWNEKGLEIWPNPSNGELNIRVDNPSGLDLRADIFDISGRLVGSFQDNSDEGTMRLAAPGLGQGLYFIKVSLGGDRVAVRKWMVQYH